MPPKSKGRAFKSRPMKAAESTATVPPKPFTKPSAKLEPFLSRLSKNHVYITHVDTKPRDFKCKIFLVPVFMNIAIIGLIIWRIKYIAPWYTKVTWSLMGGQKNYTTIDTARTPLNDIIKIILRRMVTFMIDLLIYNFVWPWPRDFFAGQKHSNPTMWRLTVGFNDKEIIIRRSRRWFDPKTSMLEEGLKQDEVFSNIRQAVDPFWMNEKTGYLMLNKEWDLDWRLMSWATKSCAKRDFGIEDFKSTVFVHSEEFGWMTIEPAATSSNAKEEEGRRKIVAFKEELTSLGKENLFFRWIELVQFESTQPGGFGPERQRATMVKAKAMFEEQGIDFDKFWEKIGGMQGMPGLDGM